IAEGAGGNARHIVTLGGRVGGQEEFDAFPRSRAVEPLAANGAPDAPDDDEFSGRSRCDPRAAGGHARVRVDLERGPDLRAARVVALAEDAFGREGAVPDDDEVSGAVRGDVRKRLAGGPVSADLKLVAGASEAVVQPGVHANARTALIEAFP